MAQDIEVFGRMIRTSSALILAELHIQNPVKTVFNGPVRDPIKFRVNDRL